MIFWLFLFSLSSFLSGKEKEFILSTDFQSLDLIQDEGRLETQAPQTQKRLQFEKNLNFLPGQSQAFLLDDQDLSFYYSGDTPVFLLNKKDHVVFQVLYGSMRVTSLKGVVFNLARHVVRCLDFCDLFLEIDDDEAFRVVPLSGYVELIALDQSFTQRLRPGVIWDLKGKALRPSLPSQKIRDLLKNQTLKSKFFPNESQILKKVQNFQKTFRNPMNRFQPSPNEKFFHRPLPRLKADLIRYRFLRLLNSEKKINSLESFFFLCQALAAYGEWEVVLDSVELFARHWAPQEKMVLSFLGEQFFLSKDWKKSIEIWDKVIDLRDLSEDQRLQAQYYRAMSFYFLGRYQNAFLAIQHVVHSPKRTYLRKKSLIFLEKLKEKKTFYYFLNANWEFNEIKRKNLSLLIQHKPWNQIRKATWSHLFDFEMNWSYLHPQITQWNAKASLFQRPPRPGWGSWFRLGEFFSFKKTAKDSHRVETGVRFESMSLGYWEIGYAHLRSGEVVLRGLNMAESLKFQKSLSPFSFFAFAKGTQSSLSHETVGRLETFSWSVGPGFALLLPFSFLFRLVYLGSHQRILTLFWDAPPRESLSLVLFPQFDLMWSRKLFSTSISLNGETPYDLDQGTFQKTRWFWKWEMNYAI